MMRHALEKGIASLIAKFLLESRHDALFESIARANALPPEELEKLRSETLEYLGKVQEDGAPYADAVMGAAREVGKTVAEMNPGLTMAGGLAARTARAAVEHAMHRAGDTVQFAGEMARKAASNIPEPPPAKASTIPDPPVGKAPTPARSPDKPEPSSDA